MTCVCIERIYLTADRSCTTKYFWKTLIKVCSPHLSASIGTFWVLLGQLFAAQWVFKNSEEFRNQQHFASIRAICRFSNILQRVTVPRIVDQFGRKRCQKKRNEMKHKLRYEFFQKYSAVHKQSAVKNSFSTYTYVMPWTVYFGWICMWVRSRVNG